MLVTPAPWSPCSATPPTPSLSACMQLSRSEMMPNAGVLATPVGPAVLSAGGGDVFVGSLLVPKVCSAWTVFGQFYVQSSPTTSLVNTPLPTTSVVAGCARDPTAPVLSTALFPQAPQVSETARGVALTVPRTCGPAACLLVGSGAFHRPLLPLCVCAWGGQQVAALVAALAVAVVPEVRVGVCYELWATPPSPSKRRVRPLWGGPVVCVGQDCASRCHPLHSAG